MTSLELAGLVISCWENYIALLYIVIAKHPVPTVSAHLLERNLCDLACCLLPCGEAQRKAADVS